MKAKTLMVLALLGVLLVLAAVWLGAIREPVTDAGAERERLLPGLHEQINAVQRVRITAAEGTVTLERADGAWRVQEKAGYPADLAALRTLLLALAGAERVEAKTASPELYDRLGVEEVTAQGGSGVLVELRAGDALHAVIVGNARNGEGTYVRLPDQAQSWLVDRAIQPAREPREWLHQELAQIGADRVRQVLVEPAGGDDPVAIAANEDGPGFVIANLPEGREPQSDYVAEATAGFLSALRLQDVRREGEGAFATDADTLSHARFSLRDGIVVAVDFLQEEGGLAARFDASLDEERAAVFVTGEQAKAAMEYERAQRAAADAAAQDGVVLDGGSQDGPAQDSVADDTAAADAVAEADAVANDPAVDEAAATQDPAPAADAPLAVSNPEADRAARMQALRGEVAALQQRFAGWIFTLPPYKAEHLAKPLTDYLAPED